MTHTPGPNADTFRSIIVIPTYQEAENVQCVLRRVLDATISDVLVVDDNSPDGTAGLVRAERLFGTRVHLLERPGKAGLGAAYRAGFAWALDRGYDQIVQMDADLSHPPERVPALLAELTDHDIVVGSRYMRGGAVENWPLSRKLISRGGNWYVRFVLGLRVHDATAGFKAFRADALSRIGATGSESNGYCFQIENTWRAQLQDMRVCEVPITFVDRTHGRSKMSHRIVFEAMLRVLRWRINRARQGAVSIASRASAS